jgi:HlyD family secretion protein
LRANWLWTALILMLVAGGSYALYAYLQPQPLPDQLLYGSGSVEGTEIRVSAEIAGRVLESRLSEGEPVEHGDLLVALDATELRLRAAQAEAEIRALEQESERIGRELELARHHLGTAEAELARYRRLAERGTAPERRLEQAQDAFAEARARLAALEAGLATADAQVVAGQRGLDLIGREIEKTQVEAPVGGTILSELVEEGEFVQPGQPVAIIVDLSEVEVRIFVPERDIGRIALGAPARVRVDAFPERLFEGRVARIDQRAQFTPRDIHLPEERVRTVFGITLALDNPERLLKPGMPVDAWILWRAEAGWPERLFVPE